MAAGVNRLQLALEGAVLSVQGMFVTVFTGLHHFHCNLNVTKSLERRKRKQKYIDMTVRITD